MDMKATCAQKPPVYKHTDVCIARTNYWQQFWQSISKRAMNGFFFFLWRSVCCMRACLRESCVFMLTCVHLCLCYVSGRVFSPEQYVVGRTKGLRLSRKFPESIQKRGSPSRSAEAGLPMTSFTLTHCLFDPAAVSVVCCPSSCYTP